MPLEVTNNAGQRVYLSPQPTYKAGRASPAWFARIAEPVFVPRRIAAGSLTLILTRDSSRASLDAWDSLFAMMAWACALLTTLFISARWALNRALHPLDQIKAALECTGRGSFRYPASGLCQPRPEPSGQRLQRHGGSPE